MFCMVVATMIALMIAAFSGFNPVFFIFFALMAIATVILVIVTIILDSYYFTKSKDYEDVVIKILHEWN